MDHGARENKLRICLLAGDAEGLLESPEKQRDVAQETAASTVAGVRLQASPIACVVAGKGQRSRFSRCMLAGKVEYEPPIEDYQSTGKDWLIIKTPFVIVQVGQDDRHISWIAV